MNNFKEYEKRLVSGRGPNLERVKNNLTETRRSVGFVSDMVELYISRLFEYFSTISPGDQAPAEEKRKYPSEE